MRVAAIPGEGAAAEALAVAVSILEGLLLPIEWSHPLVGEAAVEKVGEPFPSEAKAVIDDSDAALFGATSGASAAALFYLRWGRETFANVRPSFSTTAASVPRWRVASTSSGSVPGRIVSTSSRLTSGAPADAAAALNEVTPGTTTVS